MAIKDEMYASISGTVGRTGSFSKGSYAVIEVKCEGAQYPDRVTAWGLEATTGERISVKGWLSWKKSEKDGKTYVDVSLNKPEVTARESITPAPYADESPF